MRLYVPLFSSPRTREAAFGTTMDVRARSPILGSVLFLRWPTRFSLPLTNLLYPNVSCLLGFSLDQRVFCFISVQSIIRFHFPVNSLVVFFVSVHVTTQFSLLISGSLDFSATDPGRVALPLADSSVT